MGGFGGLRGEGGVGGDEGGEGGGGGGWERAADGDCAWMQVGHLHLRDIAITCLCHQQKMFAIAIALVVHIGSGYLNVWVQSACGRTSTNYFYTHISVGS